MVYKKQTIHIERRITEIKVYKFPGRVREIVVIAVLNVFKPGD